MNERVPSAVAVVSSLVIIAYACATFPTTNTNPSPTPPTGASTQAQPDSGRADFAAHSLIQRDAFAIA